MTSAIAKLVSLGSAPLGGPSATDGPAHSILSARNGFYAFEGALLVRPNSSRDGVLGVGEWNSETLWRQDYQGLADGLYFFAEDIFGVQFCTRDGIVLSFDPETGATSQVAVDLEDWAARILQDYKLLTGHAVASAWQHRHGPLGPGRRLIPKTPFVLGGAFEIDNLFDSADVEGMRVRASLAVQIRDLPEGTEIDYSVEP